MQTTSLIALANKALRRNQHRNCHATEAKKPQIDELLLKVGAIIRQDQNGKALVFSPLLAGPEVDKKRWEQACELEALFQGGG